MPLYTVISKRTITEAHTIWAHSFASAEDVIQRSRPGKEDGDLRPLVLDQGPREIEDITLVREDTRGTA
jgi:hypothetical protein